VRAFRADKRLFSVGDEIRTAAEYVGRFGGERSAFEWVLNLFRPRSLERRAAYLFLFESREAAVKYAGKMAGGKLYEVEIDEAKIKNRGDMGLLERAFQSQNWLKRVSTMRAYWRSEMTSKPIVELTAPAATVVNVIFATDNERRREYVRAHRLVDAPSVYYDPPR
jgi:hypothetical protein